ncbi:DNA helicase [Pseudomonas phage PA5]|uniref:DNA helicase n=1 Tax=Pseudomonas phage PA5 TaxID=1913570 RepID=A0A1J0MIM1_9CAUD|nr:DNA helicase [Pseudomonas phage PA5]APD20770.1 DNA helicase [Pseudomonas phage PA5]
MKAKTYPVKGMKTEAMQHQFNALAASLNKRNFAYLMEQGTGKTWTTLADAVRLFLQGRVDALLIVAPKGVHTNWILREIPTHVAIKTLSVDWRGRPTSKKARARLDRLYAETFADEKVLRVFAINVDAINHQAGYDEVERFLKTSKSAQLWTNPRGSKTHKPNARKRLLSWARRPWHGASFLARL